MRGQVNTGAGSSFYRANPCLAKVPPYFVHSRQRAQGPGGRDSPVNENHLAIPGHIGHDADRASLMASEALNALTVNITT